MSGLNLSKPVPEFLANNPETKLKAREIAEYLFATFPEACAAKKAAASYINTDNELLSQIVAEIGSRRPWLIGKHPKIRITEGKPRLYYWTEAIDEDAVAEAEALAPVTKTTSVVPVVKEADLYPKLTEFLWADQQIYSMRIDEKVSSNKLGPNGNRWLFPDLVAMEDLTADWHKDTSAIVAQYADRKCRLWSFEVKVLLNRSNLRESFFQAVSNSSRANFGYLVAAEISGNGIQKEIRMLSALHGIGIIKLNVENPAESEILFQARERDEVDWASGNRLVHENKDFQRFI